MRRSALLVPVVALAVLAWWPEAGVAVLEPTASGGAVDVPAETRLTIVATGDLLIHQPVAAAAATAGGGYDFRPLLARIRPIVRRADLAFCHAETPIAAGALSGYPIFNAPAELAAAIRWTGWDACSTASNHSVDRGQAGIAATRAALRRAGVRATGTARSRAGSRRILVLRRAGLDVAFLSYTYGTNGLPLPHPWSVNLISVPRIVADARRARRQGADLVLVNLHWGAEYVHAPTAEQRRVARAVLRSGRVDAIVAQHAHVVQPIGRIAGRPVVYGEGNLLSAQSSACCPAAAQDGLIAVLHVRARGGRARVTRVEYVPTRVLHPGYVVTPVGPRLRRLVRGRAGATPEAQELRDSYRRTVAVAGRSAFVRPVPARLP